MSGWSESSLQRLQPEEIESQLFPILRRGYDTEKVDAFLRVVAAYYRDALRASEEVVQASTSQTRGFEAIGGQIASILATASTAAEDLKAEAEREAQRMRRMAADEAAETTQAATNQLAIARQLKADAQQEAEAIRSEASAEAAKLRHDARERVNNFEAGARARIAKLEESAKANVEAFLEEARRRYQELRGAERQSAAHLSSVQATIRKAREALSADYATMQIADLLGHNSDADGDGIDGANGAGGAYPAIDRSIDQSARPVGYARLRWSDASGPSAPARVRKKSAYENSARGANQLTEVAGAGSDGADLDGPGDR